ncbi:MAG: hypothetical protein ACRDXB_03085, partial [Actinomycetes bacterium]
SSPLLELAPALPVSGLGDVLATVDRELSDDPTREQRLRLREHYLGDTTPGASTRRFVAACERLMEIRDREVARIEAYGAPSAAPTGNERGTR